MDAQQILTLYLVIFFIQLAWDTFLTRLNLSHVEQNSNSVPENFKNHIDLETYKKAVSYTLVKGRFGLIASLYSSIVLLVFILSGFFGMLDNQVARLVPGLYTQGIVFIFALSLIFSILNLPFSLYSVFGIEERFGFNKMTFKLWFFDLLKNLLVSAIILIPLLYGLFWFMDATGELWWLYAFFFLSATQLVLMYVYPVWIAPMFNKFTPMPEGELKNQIERLAKKVNFKTSGIFLMDGSKRSTHGNAYFTGFGANKRIVLFDTLVDSLKDPETLAVLAHEMGHEKKKHIKKSLGVSLLMTLIGFWLLSLLISYEPLFLAFGFNSISYHGALIIFSFIASPITYFLTPLFSVMSRKFEYEADRFAVKATGSAEPLINALIGLSKKSLSNLNPHPLYSFFHYSHPTLAERIEAMKKI